MYRKIPHFLSILDFSWIICYDIQVLYKSFIMSLQPENLYIFDGLSEDEIAYFIMMGEKASKNIGEYIIKQWEESDGSAYFIASWSVKVLHNDQEMAIIGPGGFFGEIALMFDEPRTATVIAIDPVELLVFHKDEFVMLLKKNQDAHMKEEIMRRIRANAQA